MRLRSFNTRPCFSVDRGPTVARVRRARLPPVQASDLGVRAWRSRRTSTWLRAKASALRGAARRSDSRNQARTPSTPSASGTRSSSESTASATSRASDATSVKGPPSSGWSERSGTGPTLLSRSCSSTRARPGPSQGTTARSPGTPRRPRSTIPPGSGPGGPGERAGDGDQRLPVGLPSRVGAVARREGDQADAEADPVGPFVPRPAPRGGVQHHRGAARSVEGDLGCGDGGATEKGRGRPLLAAASTGAARAMAI